MEKGSLKQYYRQIGSHLACPIGRKRQIMENIRSGVKDFLLEKPDADMAAIMQHFGTPEQIAESYLSEMDPKELQKSLNTKRKVLGVLVIAVAATLGIWLTAVIIASVHEWEMADGYYEVGEINVLEEGETIPPMEDD